MSQTPSNRRRFRFSLRTLLLVVTLIGGFLGYHLHWIRQRQVFLARDGVQVHTIPAGQQVFYTNPFQPGVLVPRDPNAGRAPGFLWLFGERGVSDLSVSVIIDDPFEEPPPDLYEPYKLAQKLFPEANVFSNVSDSEEWNQIHRKSRR